MAGIENQKYYVAELTVGSNKGEVELSEITVESCIARVNFIVRPYQQGVLQVHTHQGDERISSFKPIKIVVESIKQRTGDVGAFFIQLKFKTMVSASQGVVQVLHLQKKESSLLSEAEKKPVNNALRMKRVSCPLCDQTDIKFHTLEKGAMAVKANIFGVPKYMEPYSGYDFCDFNLIRIATCPSCYFSSNDINEFVRISADGEEKSAGFDANAISIHWLDKKHERKHRIVDCLSRFFDEERSVKQAIKSYELAIISSDAIFEIDKDRRPRLRNYAPVRKATYFLLIKAELLMQNSQIKEAKAALKEVERRLTIILPMLTGEFSIRSAYLLGLLNVYFEEKLKAGKYLTFLTDYNKSDSLDSASKECKELVKNTEKLKEIIQNRDDFSAKNLTGFDKPY